MTIWKVKGFVMKDSGSGGPETWFYVTPDSMTLPDVTKKFDLNNRDFIEIHSIEAICTLGDVPMCGSELLGGLSALVNHSHDE